ncbi:tRNA-U16,U17-dihydrouridine synthase [Thiogranum longum]|uniref:tRNA-dihydrouridine(20/20a) synthase n=1 Tax=Thiogranum longum TaxID=1537524 RepID=A0A4R1HC10_9GAMM|nr:tRNA dihydrouridine(20/20a) synthase DusA [Thiogranum longum]TCK18141.1 tRNA-U16,U17-dihydrouridine synthase [Thiogranum longum]
MKPDPRSVSVAPMLDWTDQHCRYFLRLLAPSARLFTEMITTGALTHGDRERFLRHHPAEQPVAVQLGGSDPQALALCAEWSERAGFNEVNLNAGCPSDRVQSGRFGACLMLEPATVAASVAAMRETVDIPVTVKCRLGVDEQDSYAILHDFTARLAEAGVSRLYVHARKAWLKGLSPKQNREVPPLDYSRVYRLKQDFPGLEIHINGGVKTLEEVVTHLQNVDGVMIGREAYHNPWFLARLEMRLSGVSQMPTRHAVVYRLLPYIEQQLAEGVRLHAITRHILGLFQGCPGARAWRRTLSEQVHQPDAGIEIIGQALNCLPPEDECAG